MQQTARSSSLCLKHRQFNRSTRNAYVPAGLCLRRLSSRPASRRQQIKMETRKEDSADVADASGVLVDSVSSNQGNVESETGSDGRIGHDSTDIKNAGAAATSGINKSGGSSDAVANGLYTILAAAIRDFDSKAQSTLKSQDQLDSAIDRLTRELDQLLEDAPLLFVVQHAAKISAVRKRVSSLNSLLKSIQQRIDNVDRILSAGVHQEKTTAESS